MLEQQLLPLKRTPRRLCRAQGLTATKEEAMLLLQGHGLCSYKVTTNGKQYLTSVPLQCF